MEVSYDGISRIIQWTGYSRYLQPDGTIGVRHVLSAQEQRVGCIEISPYVKLRYQDGLSLTEIRSVLKRDIHEYEKIVNRLVSVGISQAAFDVLVAFCVLIGKRDFIRSTFVDRINAGEPAEEIAAEIVELVEAFKE